MNNNNNNVLCELIDMFSNPSKEQIEAVRKLIARSEKRRQEDEEYERDIASGKYVC